MPEQILDGADVVAILQKVGSKGMPQYMRSAGLDNAGPANRVLERSL